MILNIKESFRGQYTFQKPAWRDECQFLPFRSMYKKKGPLAGGLLLCKSHFTDLFQHVKIIAALRRHSGFTFSLCVAKTNPQRGRKEKGHCVLMLSLMVCPRLWEAQAGLSILCSLGPGVLEAWGGICLPVEVSTGISSSPRSSVWLHLQVALGNGTFLLFSGLQRPAHTPLPPTFFSFFFFLPFFPCFNQILGTRTPRAGSDQAYN